MKKRIIPAEIAVALHYNPSQGRAPEINALGMSQGARDIKKIARRYAIPLYEHLRLAEKLARCPADSTIPEELFDEVAKIFVSLDRLK